MSDDSYWTDLTPAQTAARPTQAPAPRVRSFDVGEDREAEVRALLAEPVADATDDLYALVDAAKVTFFADRADAEDLEHATLFSGETAEDTQSVAPYLVRLPSDSLLLRQALDMTEKDPRAFGGSAGVVFVRSSANLATLRAHFRRFTRQRDRSGAWFYVRFYDPTVLPAYLGALSSEKRPVFFGPVARFVAPEADRMVVLDRG